MLLLLIIGCVACGGDKREFISDGKTSLRADADASALESCFLPKELGAIADPENAYTDTVVGLSSDADRAPSAIAPRDDYQSSHTMSYVETTPSASNISPLSRSKLEVVPKVSFLDAPVEIFVSQLAPMQLACLRVTVTDSIDNKWKSIAYFDANFKGEVNPAFQEPLSGSTYSGAHAMGLFWSLVPERLQSFQTSTDLLYEITIETEDAVTHRESIHRIAYHDTASMGIEIEELREDIYANFYRIQAENGKPTIILLGGSGGRFQTETALYLAGKGYPVLDLMYFGKDGLPKRLERVPLEYLDGAVQWVRQRRMAASPAVVLMGRSRGAEYALQYAAKFDEIQAVISVVGYDLVWSAKSYFRSSWTLDGKDLPFARGTLKQALGYLRKSNGTGQSQLSYFESGLGNRRRVKRAAIEVERINAPILLLSGKSDLQWPSSEMSERLMLRARQHGFPHQIKHIAYDDAGHEFLALPFIPQPDYSQMMTWASGGTPQGNALAAIDAWRQIFGFLEKIHDERLDTVNEGM